MNEFYDVYDLVNEDRFARGETFNAELLSGCERQ
jgi:hypothetical protein